MTDDAQQDDGSARRRALLAAALLLTFVAILILFFSTIGADTAELRLDDSDAWIHGGANTEFATDSNNAVTFGDPSETLTIEWSGFSPEPTEVEFEVAVAGLRGGENSGVWSNGDFETELAVLAEGSYTVEGESGTAELTWEDIFGEARPVAVGDHPDIDRTDFEAPDGVRSRPLGIEVEATAPDENVVAEGGTMLGAILGINSMYEVEPASDFGSARMAVVVHGPSQAEAPDETEPEPEPEPQPEPEPASDENIPETGGGGGGGVVPIPTPTTEEIGVSGFGSFVIRSEEVAEDE